MSRTLRGTSNPITSALRKREDAVRASQVTPAKKSPQVKPKAKKIKTEASSYSKAAKDETLGGASKASVKAKKE